MSERDRFDLPVVVHNRVLRQNRFDKVRAKVRDKVCDEVGDKDLKVTAPTVEPPSQTLSIGRMPIPPTDALAIPLFLKMVDG